jgi:hypothetical protein
MYDQSPDNVESGGFITLTNIPSHLLCMIAEENKYGVLARAPEHKNPM